MYTANKIETFHPAHRRGYDPSQVSFILCLLTTGLFYFAAVTNTANATDYYLADPKGADSIAGTADDIDSSDSYPGTSEQPWANLDRAYTWYGGAGPKVQEGDTVLFRNGSYGAFTESTNVNPGEAYLFYRNNWITYKAAPGHTPTLSSITVKNDDRWSGKGNGNSYLIFDGFQIADKVNILYTSYVKVLNCDITQTPEAYEGTYAPYYAPNHDTISGRDSNYITIQSNHIHNVYRGICPSGEYWTIKGNTIHYLAEDGINGPVSNSTIEGNLIYDSSPYRTCRTIAGEKTGTFTEGETVTQAGTNAVGIVHEWRSEGYLNVYQTTSVEFQDQTHGGGTVTGQTGTVSNITLVDGSHIDGIHIENTTRLHDVNIIGNIVRDMPMTQAISLYGHGVFDHFTIENNLVDITNFTGNKTLVISGVNNVRINNNTLLGSFARFENTAAHPYTSIINELYNNIIDDTVFESDHAGTYIQVVSHGNNIFGNNPNGSCGPTYPFAVNSTEVVDYNISSLFVGAASNDFNLAPTSDAIDFGNSNYGPSSDILGVSRVFPPDAGCYEFVSSDPNSQIYSITASASGGGTISPSGLIQVVSGGSQTYSITKNTGYDISDVVVDGNSVGVRTSYTFSNVTANHTIDATFAINTTYYTITATPATPGPGGQISPSGTTQVASGSSQTYSITKNTGYDISDVVVDGNSVGVRTSYTFSNVTANHTIAAIFAIDTYTITASAGNGGQISPSGTTQVPSGGSQTYNITANAGYHISDVLVDGSSVGDVNSYPFTNVTADHTIAATFAIDEQDDTAPTITNLKPQAESIQAPLNTLVILDITDSGDGVDANSVTINVNDNIVYSGNTARPGSTTYGECHRIGTKAHYAFIYQSNEMFDFDQPINVTAKATDLADNVMDEYSYSFKTEMRSFGRNKRVDPRDVKKGRPVTVRDSNGNVWAAWHAGVTGSRDIYIGKLLVDEEYFGDSIKITGNLADQCNPVIAVDSDNKLYVAWQDNRRGNWDIYVSTSNDWSAEIRVTDSNANQINPAIVIDSNSPNNNAYIVWEDDRHGNQDIYVARSSNGFATKTVSPITSDISDQVEPAVAADSDSTIYVVWTDTRIRGKKDIYGAASNNGPWTNVPVVTEEDGQSSPAIATEAVGSILHLVWVDDRPGDRDIFYAKTSGGLPGSPLTGSSIIDDTTGANQLSPVIITTGYTGNDLKVFACWRDERNADADLYAVEIGAGAGTNVFVGDDGTNSDQSEPAIGIDEDGHPYLVWTNERTDICYAGSTFIESELASTNVSITSEATVGTMRNAIQSVDDVSAEVPQGAYLCDVKVTISRIKNPQKFNFERSTGVYEFGPSGMEFTKPVTITIPYEVNGSENASYKAYWYNSLTNTLSQQGITDVETIVISSNLHALRFKTTHFSPFILGGAVLGGLLGGGGGGGGCSMSPNSQDSIAGLLLPYIGLAVAMVILKLRDRRKRKAHNITKSGC